MDAHAVTSRPSPSHGFRNIVESYVKNRIPRDLHPSYEAIDDEVAAESRPSPPPYSQTEPILSTSQKYPEECAEEYDEEEIPLEELYSDAEDEKRRFVSAMEQYEQFADPKYRTHITSQQSHTWEQILSQVDEVASSYQDTSSFWGRIRQGIRNFGINHDALTAWMDLLPNQSQYFSILCGGIKLILGAAARLKDLRNDICEALAKIPLLLTNTKIINGVFKKSKELHKCSSTLYVKTLATLEHIVTWYKQKAAKKFFKAFFKQDIYEELLVDKMRALELSSEAFGEAAKICSYQRQERLLREVQVHRTETHQTHQILERCRSEAAERHGSLGDIMKNEANDIRLGVSEMEMKITKLEETNIGLQGMVKDLLKCFLSGNERINPKSNDLREPVLPANKLASKFARLKQQRLRVQEEMLIILDYDESIPQGDIKTILRIAWTLARPAQDRAVTLMQSPKLHAWIASTEPSILLVNGNCNNASARQSPLSFVCAKLMDSIQPALQEAEPRKPSIFAHAFFCGQHMNPEDPDSGLSGMMRSLLAQLLVSYPEFNLSIIQRLRDIDSNSVSSLCDVFSTLIIQIPPEAMIFCLIDGITLHESSKSQTEEAHTVAQTLVDITKNCKEHGCVFKVLLTSAGNSRAVYKDLDKADVMWMPRNVSSQGGFTSMKWKHSAAARDVRELTAD